MSPLVAYTSPPAKGLISKRNFIPFKPPSIGKEQVNDRKNKRYLGVKANWLGSHIVGGERKKKQRGFSLLKV